MEAPYVVSHSISPIKTKITEIERFCAGSLDYSGSIMLLLVIFQRTYMNEGEGDSLSKKNLKKLGHFSQHADSCEVTL